MAFTWWQCNAGWEELQACSIRNCSGVSRASRQGRTHQLRCVQTAFLPIILALSHESNTLSYIAWIFSNLQPMVQLARFIWVSCRGAGTSRWARRRCRPAREAVVGCAWIRSMASEVSYPNLVSEIVGLASRLFWRPVYWACWKRALAK
jgi:hypothetical protein